MEPDKGADVVADLIGSEVTIRFLRDCRPVSVKRDILGVSDAGLIVGRIETTPRGLSGSPMKLARSTDHLTLPWDDILSIDVED